MCDCVSEEKDSILIELVHTQTYINVEIEIVFFYCRVCVCMSLSIFIIIFVYAFNTLDTFNIWPEGKLVRI